MDCAQQNGDPHSGFRSMLSMMFPTSFSDSQITLAAERSLSSQRLIALRKH
jgi:hypothetical protein